MTSTTAEAVDMRHLDRYTGGDRAITEEILTLFEQQCAEMLAKLDQIAGAGQGDVSKDWREVTHTLKGAARGIGAFSLGDAAAMAEKTEPRGTPAVEAVMTIKARAEAVSRFIENFINTR